MSSNPNYGNGRQEALSSPNDPKIPEWFEEYVPIELTGSYIFQVNVNVAIAGPDGPKVETVRLNMLPAFDVDYDRVEDQLMQAASEYGHWSQLYQETRIAANRAERKLKIRRAELAEYIHNAQNSAGVKLTNDRIKNMVESTPEIKEAEFALLDFERNAAKLWSMLKVLEMKFEACRSMVSVKKQERDKS